MSSRISRRQVLGLLGTGVGLGLRGSSGVVSALAQTPANSSRGNFPKDAIIRTILKDVPPDSLADGTTLFHEHISGNFSNPPAPAGARGGAPEAARSVDLAVDELKQAWADGVHCIVDATTNRRSAENIERVESMARRSGMNVVVAGGYYRAPYPPAIAGMSEEQIGDQLIGDARTQRWGAIGEIGSSVETHPDERKFFRAVARLHVRTNLPIFTHTPHESCPGCALEQLDLLEKAGVNPRSICIGHISSFKPPDDPGMTTAKSIAKRGAFVGFDTVGHIGRTSLVTEAEKVKMLLQVLEGGFEDQVLLAADFSINEQLKANYGAGFSSAVVVFVPKLRYAGVKEATIHKILHDNPRRFLAFAPKA
jgi:phosphotriesterase-related protein